MKLTADLVLKAVQTASIGDAAVKQDWIQDGLEELGFSFDGDDWSSKLRLFGQLLKRLTRQGLLHKELLGTDLYERDPFYSLTQAGLRRLSELDAPAPVARPGRRSRGSALAERLTTA